MDIAFAKQRALDLYNSGNYKEAVASMVYDIGKIPDYGPAEVVPIMAMVIIMNGYQPNDVRDFITGFAE